MRHNSLRLRLTRSEVAALAEHGLVREGVEFADGRELVYELRGDGDGPRIAAMLEDRAIRVSVPREMVAGWAASESVGMEGDDGALRILIEKDFQCMHGEQDPDAYEGPRTGDKLAGVTGGPAGA